MKKPEPLSKILFRATLGFFVAVLIYLVILVTYWLIAPYEVATIEEPIPVLNSNREIAVGDRIQLNLVIEKKLDAKATVNINITCDSGNLVTMTPLGRTLPAGQFDVINDSYILPPKLAVGDRCQFNFLNFYDVNPLRTISETWSSETFTVIERE